MQQAMLTSQEAFNKTTKELTESTKEIKDVVQRLESKQESLETQILQSVESRLAQFQQELGLKHTVDENTKPANEQEKQRTTPQRQPLQSVGSQQAARGFASFEDCHMRDVTMLNVSDGGFSPQWQSQQHAYHPPRSPHAPIPVQQPMYGYHGYSHYPGHQQQGQYNNTYPPQPQHDVDRNPVSQDGETRRHT